ncbi:hypothetical protein B0I35DRAFT_437187 [Stachybotrys elegans]|uniref:BZIP domain-containing protein n=1 Tax=Stachybotrys elegans TaxID=80388 RepID=A0A8K0SQT7_9HYPO|nr:hypothetical protein B0I35DRAFT_437187 [Stachybotrys elegans]
MLSTPSASSSKESYPSTMASAYLFHQSAAVAFQDVNMSNLGSSQDIVVDPLLGASYPDPLSSALRTQSATHASAQLAESSEGAWEQFNFQLGLLNESGQELFQQTPLPATSTLTTNNIFTPPRKESEKTCLQTCLQKANDRNDNTGRNRNLEGKSPPTTPDLSPSLSNITTFSSQGTQETRLSHGRASFHSESTMSSPPEPAPSSKRKCTRGPRTRKYSTTKKDKDKDEDARRDKFLERNRQAASKCRQKKKEWVQDLEESRADLEAKNNNLHNQYEELLSEVTEIKNSLLWHATCDDPVINEWINTEARKYVETSLKMQQARRETETEMLKAEEN